MSIYRNDSIGAIANPMAAPMVSWLFLAAFPLLLSLRALDPLAHRTLCFRWTRGLISASLLMSHIFRQHFLERSRCFAGASGHGGLLRGEDEPI
jgi:hypothetical protein